MSPKSPSMFSRPLLHLTVPVKLLPVVLEP